MPVLTRRSRILLVDDNPSLLRSIERLLQLEGFQVVLATDGSDALRQLEVNEHPDLIISDIGMPNMDGFDLFRAVRERADWLDIPFIFLTARDQLEDLRQGYTLGADDYLVKPLDQERLLLVVQSKLKRRAELLSRLEVQQHALNDAKRELAHMVAHELRTPLMSINMVTEILSREVDKMGAEQVHDMLETMQTGSARLTRLVEQMVMYVQLQSGSLRQVVESHLRPSYVRDAVIGAVDRARMFSYRQPEIAVKYEETAPDAMISGDLASLRHALAELLSNAMAFSPPDGEVIITQWVEDGRVWVTVDDWGAGIPLEEMPYIFEPFYQVNRRRREQQGIGIGLALAKGIIEAHDGTLALRSEEGRGTQAVVSLPLAQVDV